MPQTFEGLIEVREGAVLHLTIDRPGDLNRLSPELVDYLTTLVARLREDPTSMWW